MTQQTTTRKLSTGARLVMLALVAMMLLGVALAAPSRLNAQATDATNATQMLVFDWNKPVMKSHSGFAQYKPLGAFPQFPNGNWLSPINWTNGTLYFRVKVLSIPQNQPKMKLGFCFWQSAPRYGEECTKNYALAGVPGNEGRWSQSFGSMTVINKAPINWALPRWKEGFVVRNGRTPVSGKLNFNWAGQNPDNWYPMNIHYTVVLVAPGGGAPNWTQYGWPNN
jgi:hypothetical protein